MPGTQAADTHLCNNIIKPFIFFRTTIPTSLRCTTTLPFNPQIHIYGPGTKIMIYIYICPSQWPRGLRHRSAAARLLRSWVWIPMGAWMFVCCECCVLWGRGLCDELITRPEESYWLWGVVCDLETSRMRRPWPALGRSATAKKKYVYICVRVRVRVCLCWKASSLLQQTRWET